MQASSSVVSAHELRSGDRILVDGTVRTVADVFSGSAETRVDLSGAEYPPFFIVWNGEPCPLVTHA